MSSLWVKFNKLPYQNFQKVGNRYWCDVASDICKAFKDYGVIPDVVDKAPEKLATVCFESGVTVSLGNTLTPTNVKDLPKLLWKANDECFYTLCMTDPDAPSRKAPEQREWQHWLVGNIPGCDICKGQTLTEFVPSAPPEGTCKHRYVILIYMQPEEICFEDVPFICCTSAEGRAKFSIKNFATKFNLGDPYAGNFYQAQFDCHVLKVYKQLGIKIKVAKAK